MAIVGEFPLHSLDNMEYLWPHINGNGSGSELSGSGSSSFGATTGDLQFDKLGQPFDLSEYFVEQPLVQEAISPPLMDCNTRSNNEVERPRTERIAFRMKSPVEIIDDGFKWRKYGKKSVKNSPNPRNYYKCSTEGCLVKKRVERDGDDKDYVITTYEGFHNHVSPSLVYYTNQDAASGKYYLAGFQNPPSS